MYENIGYKILNKVVRTKIMKTLKLGPQSVYSFIYGSTIRLWSLESWRRRG